MDTFEHALIVKAGKDLMTFGPIPRFGGQTQRVPVDVLEHLNQVGSDGWALTAVEDSGAADLLLAAPVAHVLALSRPHLSS